MIWRAVLVTWVIFSPRRPRADAKHNKATLLKVAKSLFAERGAGVSLEQIAREAGVGIGTLYRHFPTRDALIAAVYQQETDTLVRAASDLAATLPPLDALQGWLLLFIDFLETKQTIGDMLDTLIGGPEPLYSATPTRLSDAIAMLLTCRASRGIKQRRRCSSGREKRLIHLDNNYFLN